MDNRTAPQKPRFPLAAVACPDYGMPSTSTVFQIHIHLVFLVALWSSQAVAIANFPWYAGTDSLGEAKATTNEQGSVMIESPEAPRGLWIHVKGETGEALQGIDIYYRNLFKNPKEERRFGRNRLVSIALWGGPAVQDVEIWTRLPDDPVMHVTLYPREVVSGYAFLRDWRIELDLSTTSLPFETKYVEMEKLGDLHSLLGSDFGVVRTPMSELAIGGQAQGILDHLNSSSGHLISYQGKGPRLFATEILHTTSFWKGMGTKYIFLYLPVLADAELDREAYYHLGPFFTGDLHSFKHIWSNDLWSLGGIEHLAGLKTLTLWNFDGRSLNPLSGLTNLEELKLHGDFDTDLSPLANLTNFVSWNWIAKRALRISGR